MSTVSIGLPEGSLDWRLPSTRTRRDVVPDRRRGRDLHDFRGGLSLLYRQERHRPAAQGCFASADLLYGLPASEQPDDAHRRAQD